MTPPAPADQAALSAAARLSRAALALAIGALGGWIASLLQLPLAWMIGAMTATTIAALAAAPVAVPPRLRSVMVTVLGIMLGSAFTPDLAANIPRWIPSLASLLLYGAATTAVLYFYFRRVAGYDPTTAYFSSVPGGLNEMVIVGGIMGGDDRTISLIHGARILLVVATVPIWFVLIEGYDRETATGLVMAWADIPIDDLLILAACAPLGMITARALKLPAANLTGPMILSAAAHMSGTTAAQPPAELVSVAQVVVGSAVGCRFAGLSVTRILRTLLVACGATAIMVTVTLFFAFGLHGLLGIGVPALVLAFAPGGLAEMSLIALALGIDAAFVSTHHVLRIVLLVITAPLFWRRLQRHRDSKC